jgi:hypothetical protein
VEVIEEPFEDASEPDAYYSGVVYRFVFSEREIRAGRDDDRPGEAHFLGLRYPGDKRGLFEAIPYDNPEFREAALYLRDTVGADTVTILLPGGYVPVDFTQFPGLQEGSTNAGDVFHCFQCRAAIPDGLDKCPKCGWTWQ